MFVQLLMGAVIAGYVGTCEARAPIPWQDCESRWGLVVGWMIESPVTAFAKGRSRNKQSASTNRDDIENSPS